MDRSYLNVETRQNALRAAVKDRPAGVIWAPMFADDKDDDANERFNTYCGLFNGTRNPSQIDPKSGIFTGKHETEKGWPRMWEQLRDLGVIEFEVRDCRSDTTGYEWKEVHWSITKKGWEVRDDDLAWDREMGEAAWLDYCEGIGVTVVGDGIYSFRGEQFGASSPYEAFKHAERIVEQRAGSDKTGG